nr:MAG TPA: hypothetical protein [Caudoviricetes sp.]
MGGGRTTKKRKSTRAARPSFRAKNLAFGDSCARARGVLGWSRRRAQAHIEPRSTNPRGKRWAVWVEV